MAEGVPAERLGKSGVGSMNAIRQVANLMGTRYRRSWSFPMALFAEKVKD